MTLSSTSSDSSEESKVYGCTLWLTVFVVGDACCTANLLLVCGGG